MAKQNTTNSQKKTTTTKNKNTKKLKTTNKKTTSKIENKNIGKKIIRKVYLKVTFCLLIAFGILFIFSSYAWFSTNLNVKIRTFNMIVTKNSGLTISFDGIHFDTFVEISRDTLIRDLKATYPNNKSQWSSFGLKPVSSNGISNPDTYFFDMFSSGGVRYLNKNKDHGYVKTYLLNENKINESNNYIAFDLFFKNSSGSPVSDNLYFDDGTEVTIEEDASEEMQGLLNSVRIGLVKVGSTTLDSEPAVIQNLQCHNTCKSIIYEPNSLNHTPLSIERAEKFNVTLIDGERFPTYGCIKSGGPIFIENTVSGSPNLDPDYFQIQETITEDNFDEPLFTVPSGITKVRVYLWIEGQDIDSLETDSEGAELSISINFMKDTQGYTEVE